MIWPDSGSYRNSSLLQPPASWLFLEHTHSPALLHLHWRLLCLEGTPPRHACGHSFMSFTSLLKYHLLHEAYTDHPSKTATFPAPTRLYSVSPSSEHLSISRQTLPSLTRLTLPPSPEHTVQGQQRVSVVSSLRFHRCKNRASSIRHTTNSRRRNDQGRHLCIPSSLMWTQAI